MLTAIEVDAEWYLEKSPGVIAAINGDEFESACWHNAAGVGTAKP
jgi:hypothetical protein